MFRVLAGVILAVACLHGQRSDDRLLSSPRHIVGVVVDSGGQPVAEAIIGHTNDRWKVHQSDLSGKFELDTMAPILVIRKAGFRSELVRTQDAKEVRVTLQKLSDHRTFPACSKTERYVGIESWGGSFQFLKVPGITASRQGNDIDYGARSYYIHTKSGPKGIMHGSGAMWTLGVPSETDVWSSVKYDEITYDSGLGMIIDARGQYQDGNRWRYLGKFGESAAYSNVDEETAKVLDRFLDGACLTALARH